MDSSGYYPIHFACFNGESRVLKLLDKYGARLDVKNSMGLTPIHVAAQADGAFAITFLHEHGIDVDELDDEGQTPLHWACYRGADVAIYYLLAWTKAINYQDKKGRTPLHHAVERIEKYPKLRPLKEMLIKGASRSIKDYDGNKPIDKIPSSENQDTELK